MFRDRELASMCRALYRYPEDPPSAWDIEDGPGHDGIAWGLYRAPLHDVVVLRGSVTMQDWVRNFLAIADPINGGPLGGVHSGFYRGMNWMWTYLKPMLRPGAIITGHSLGGARAQVLAGLMIVDGFVPAALVTFGSPKPGMRKLRELLSPIPHRVCYRNGHVENHEHDLVTNVPFTMLIHRYCHGCPTQDVYSVPEADDPWGIFRYHHVQLYEQALKNIQSGITGG